MLLGTRTVGTPIELGSTSLSLTHITDLDSNAGMPGEAAILQGGIKEWLKHYEGTSELVITIPEIK